MENNDNGVAKSGSEDFNSYYSQFLADLNKKRDAEPSAPSNGTTPTGGATNLDVEPKADQISSAPTFLPSNDATNDATKVKSSLAETFGAGNATQTGETPASAPVTTPPPATSTPAFTPGLSTAPAETPASTSAGTPASASIAAPNDGFKVSKAKSDTTDAKLTEEDTKENAGKDAKSAFGPQGIKAEEGAPEKPTKARPGVLYTFLVVLVTAGLTLGAVYAGLHFGVLKSSEVSDYNYDYDQAEKAFAKPSGESPDWEKVFATVAPSVVSIQVEMASGSALGSGFVLDASGDIITNNHVIEGKDAKIQVTLWDGRIFEATIVGNDETSDIAVVKLTDAPSDLKPVEFADSESVTVGDDVMAVGNPLGLANTATVGVISALERPVSAAEGAGTAAVVTNAIQIDAAINPGNSGGPLFDGEGKVIGITSSIASTSSQNPGSIGIGFAIPSNLTQLITKQLVESGKFEHPALGVSIQDGVAKYDGSNHRAAQIKEVSQNSPAGDAGLQKDDYIIAINGKPVTSTYGLMGYIRAQAIDSTIKVTYVRGDSKAEVDVKLNRKQEDALSGLSSQKAPDENGDTPDLFDPFDGLLGR
jgi:putative serine protease PepD